MDIAIRRINTVVIGAIFAIVAVAVLWPVVHLVSAAFSPGRSIANLPIIPFSNGLTGEHFEYLFT